MIINNFKKYSVLLSLLVIALTLMSIPALAEGDIACIRDISTNTISSGDTFTVTLTLSSTGSYTAPKVIEELPEGWTIRSVQDDGALFKNNEWVWVGPIGAGESRILKYEVTVPENENEGIYNINGEESVSSGGNKTIIENGETVFEYNNIKAITSGDKTITVTGTASSEDNDANEESSSGFVPAPPKATSESEPSSTSSTESTSTAGTASLEETSSDQPPMKAVEDNTNEFDTEDQDSEMKTPGFELVFAIGGLLLAVFFLKRY
ncbi:hypothetical protein HNV12_12330 [Methanococcoides sp. SA1]|nr:hypothetical protein [Methanococcoides sp. SA1]